MSFKGIFITGTDTGCGKTVITGLLARFLKEKGYKVITQKWIQTGSKNFSPDINTHLKLMKLDKLQIRPYTFVVCPYAFKFPASPHLAAALEKINLQAKKIKDSFKTLVKDFDLVIVEGTGGALAPFSRQKLVIDLAKELKLPVVIAAANKLGAINHTLLTIEALRRRRMKIIGIIFNNLMPKASKVILEDNPRIVKTVSKEKILGVLPWGCTQDKLYKNFSAIGDKIWRKITT